MKRRAQSNGGLIIGLSFLLALLLHLTPWPGPFELLRPCWLLLVLSYWVLALPNRVNLGTGFVLGLIWDLTLGAPLGVRALALTLLAYSVMCNHQILRNRSLRQQALIIMLLTLSTQCVIFCTEWLLTRTTFHPKLLWCSLVNGLLWPWVFLLLRKIRRQWEIS